MIYLLGVLAVILTVHAYGQSERPDRPMRPKCQGINNVRPGCFESVLARLLRLTRKP